MCPDNAAPGNAVGAQCVWGGEGEVVEQQKRALGNPCSSFSSSSSSLCVRRGFDKNSTLGSAVHFRSDSMWTKSKRFGFVR